MGLIQIDDIKEIQKLHYESLQYLKRICEENGLKYFLSNGTLLGAVKYQGFIPWDDDVDILMPREDYDKLLSLPNIENDKYQLFAKEKYANWKMPYAKLSLKSTVLQETSADYGCSCGLAIDIFPLDNWGKHLATSKIIASYDSLLRRFLTASIEKNFYTPKKGIRKFILYMIWLYSRMMGSDFHYRCIMKQCVRANKSLKENFIGSVAWAPYGAKEVMPKEVFNKSINLKFGDETYSAPIGYDFYLKSLYGNYQIDPPIEKQKSNHVIKVWYKQ